MARKASTTEFSPMPEINQAAYREETSALAVVSRLGAALPDGQEASVRALAAQLGYQLPADCTDPDLIQRDIAANMRRSVEACLEVGRGLTVLKMACEHGQFMARLDVLGIENSVAIRFMQAARKFSNAATSQHLVKAIGNQSKLFEMLVLDDEQIEELELTGQIGELKLDDVATMSVKELRKALRDARQNAEATGRILADKNARIDALTRDLQMVTVLPPDEKARALRQEVAALAYEAEAGIGGKLREGFARLAEHAVECGVDHRTFQAALVGQLETLLAALRSEFHLPDDLGQEAAPEWLNADVDALADTLAGA